MAGLGDLVLPRRGVPRPAGQRRSLLPTLLSGRQRGAFEIRKRLLLTKRRGLDGFLSRLIAKHRLAEMDVVGFTSMFSQNVASFAMARKLKEKSPHLVTVVGGANCEAPMGQIAATIGAVDFVFSGPALASFPAFVGHLLAGEAGSAATRSRASSRAATPRRRRGAGRDRSGRSSTSISGSRSITSRSSRPSKRASRMPTSSRSLLIETARGCWWGERAHCTFCGLNGGTMRYRSMDADRAGGADIQRAIRAAMARAARATEVGGQHPAAQLSAEDVFRARQPPPTWRCSTR